MKHQGFLSTSDKPHYENVPFEVPSSWVWTTVGEISQSILYGVSESAKSQGTYRLLRITDIQDNKVNWDTVPFTDYENEKAEAYLLKDGDILFARTGATVGKSYLVNNLKEKAIYASYLIRVQTNHYVLPAFVKYFFESGFYWEQVLDNSVGIGQPNVNGTILSNLELPIPPIMEQKRIVKELGEWLSIIDKIEESKGRIQKVISLAKSKVLDLAIHGKLVPQDPTDEPATELLKRINPKAEITCDNGHYQKLPEGWCLCLLNDVLKEVFAGGDKPLIFSKNKSEENYIPIYANGTENKGLFGFTNKAQVYERCLTISARGTIGFTCIREVPFVPIVRLITAIPLPVINLLFLKHQIDTMLSYTEGSSIPQLTIPTIKRMLIILPPLKEQLRIVAKIEELFALLDTIKAQL